MVTPLLCLLIHCWFRTYWKQLQPNLQNQELSLFTNKKEKVKTQIRKFDSKIFTAVW